MTDEEFEEFYDEFLKFRRDVQTEIQELKEQITALKGASE